MMKTTEATHGAFNDEQQHAANYAGVVHALLACEDACNACADAGLAQINHLAHFRRCIRLSLDCADICRAMLGLLMRQTGQPNQLVRAQLHACVIGCRLCADECRLMESDPPQAQWCAEICLHTWERCQQLEDDIGWNESSSPFARTRG